MILMPRLYRGGVVAACGEPATDLTLCFRAQAFFRSVADGARRSDRPVPAGGRRLDDDGFARLDHSGVAGLQLFAAAILPAHGIFANLSGCAARQTEWRHAAVARQDGAVHRLEETDGAADAVAGVPLAAAARTFADVEIFEHDGVAELQHFGIGQPRVGHV